MQVYGIDLSMKKFDVNYIDKSGQERKKEVKNNLNGISRFLATVSSGSVLCAENTGTYGDMLVFLSNQAGINIALVPGYTIKHSLGLVKGKSDPIDAGRIREYAKRFCDKLSFNQYDKEEIFELKSLYSLRSQLVKSRKILRTAEHSRSNTPMQSISVKKHANQALAHLDAEIKEVEKEIKDIIMSHQELRENYQLAISIKGIGPVITTNLIIKTGNFKTIDTARKAASHSGVCPFPDESGKMVGKRKTSPFADRKLKALLHMGAKSAVKHNPEYRLYYQRKKLEGKPHYLIMNNISNKMLRTIYSIVKNKTPYRLDYVCPDPRELKNSNSSSKKVA